ncbi:MAG TPA: hypothetical protein VK932_01575, partial [Kofleriaceae bacterium]|nr:hypothetical protein [Kofleriaceae bacterium]
DAIRVSGGVAWPYRHQARPGDPRRAPTRETPCAGSMAVWIDAQGRMDVTPRPGGVHDRFIRKVPTPLCDA